MRRGGEDGERERDTHIQRERERESKDGGNFARMLLMLMLMQGMARQPERGMHDASATAAACPDLFGATNLLSGCVVYIMLKIPF